MKEKNTYSVWDVAQKLHITPHGVRKAIRDGKMAHKSTSTGRYYFTKEQYELLQKKEKKSYIRYGWICVRCKASLSPTTTQCVVCTERTLLSTDIPVYIHYTPST